MGLGLVRCWGDNAYGQLGDGTQVARPGADLVSGISAATQVVSGKSHACALLADQSVRCWGRGDSGELGNGAFSHSSLPVVVSGLGQVTALAAGLRRRLRAPQRWQPALLGRELVWPGRQRRQRRGREHAGSGQRYQYRVAGGGG